MNNQLENVVDKTVSEAGDIRQQSEINKNCNDNFQSFTDENRIGSCGRQCSKCKIANCQSE